MEAMRRWGGLDKIVHKIEKTGSEHFKLNGTKIENTLKGIATYEDDDFRISVIRQGELLEKLESAGKTVKWGQYLRAPDVYFEILKKCRVGAIHESPLLVPLSEVAEIRRGYTTGINEFFYLDEDKIKHWGIEEEFLAPVIKSPKEAKSILFKSTDVACKVFLCHETKADLRKQQKFGALKYIEWGEKQKTKDGTAWPEVETVSGRKLWYDLGEREPGKILLQMITNDRFFAPYNADNVQVDHNLFELFPNQKAYSYGLGIYLNSSIVALFRELTSRVNLGEGATKTEGIDWKDILTPKKEILQALSEHKKLSEALQKRAIESIFEEVKMKDRQRLDSLVLEAIGLDPKKYLKPIYDGLCELVRERLELAGMRKKIKTTKTEKDVEKLVEQVINEVIPNGHRKFPEEFIDNRYLKDAKEISIPNEPLKLGRFFFGRQEILAESGFKCEAASVAEAKFIILSQKPNCYIIKLPEDKIRLKNAIDEWERYIEGLKDELFQTFFTRTHDHKLADTLVSRVMEKFEIRNI